MKALKTFAIGMALLGVGVAHAQSALPQAGSTTNTTTATPAATCCHVTADTTVELEITELVSSKDRKRGDRFGLRLHAPLVVAGAVLLPAGTPGVGEIVHADRAHGGGKPGELILAARYLQLDATQVPLHGMKLGASGKDHTNISLGVAMAVGAFGLFVHGGEIEIPPGTLAQARLVADQDLPAQTSDSTALTTPATASPMQATTVTTPRSPNPTEESH